MKVREVITYKEEIKRAERLMTDYYKEKEKEILE